jgi:transcriptional regulator with XRE-family HTH domain
VNDVIFANWFKEALKKSRLSGAELAERARISKQSVYSYLDGSRIPGPDAVVKLCAGLRVDPATVPLFHRRAVGRAAHKNQEFSI